MTKMLNVSIDTAGINKDEAEEWVNEIANVYADMEVSNVNISGNNISFQAGFSGMDDTESDDIKMRVEDLINSTEAFQVNSITVK